MSHIIVIHGLALGGGPKGFLKSYDPDAHDGLGDLVITSDLDQAQEFADAVEAMECWKAQSRTRPLRSDGKPNRPLTAFTVEVRAKEGKA